MIALVAVCAHSEVVWGIGDTYEAALADAQPYSDGDFATAHPDYRIVEISDEQVAAIRSGAIDWEDEIAPIAARSAGRAWAEREADAIVDWSDARELWLATDADALPLIDEPVVGLRSGTLASELPPTWRSTAPSLLGTLDVRRAMWIALPK